MTLDEVLAIQDDELPEMTFDGSVKDAEAKYQELVKELEPIQALRQELRNVLAGCCTCLTERFDLSAVETLRAFPCQFLKTLQAEVDLRAKFATWLDTYEKSIQDLIQAAEVARDATASEIRAKLLAAAGFDEAGQANIQKADGLVVEHPNVRKANAAMQAVHDLHRIVLDKTLRDENGGWLSPFGLNEERRRDLIQAIRDGLVQIIADSGFAPTLKYARSCHRVKIGELIGERPKYC